MEAMGIAICKIQIGQQDYVQCFIVCKKMLTPVIVRRDFLATYQLTITWGKAGKLRLAKGGQDIIQTIEEVMQHPVRTIGITQIPPRVVASILVAANLPPYGVKMLFHFVPLVENLDLDTNCIPYPLDYTSIKGGRQRAVQVLVNLGEEDLEIPSHTFLGHFELAEKEGLTIDEQGLFEVNIEEPLSMEGLEDRLFEGNGPAFITSLVDIESQPQITLWDAKVAPEHCKAFEDLCEEFDIFSKDSTNVGKTPLMQMEIPTGDNPPIRQTMYPHPKTHPVGAR